ncbi:MAG: hypothetical protein KAU50_06545 [Candidatus Marinimicrobia bacterium]|nr:hypothetical protein [Candidatus Neomarinimicrobiota bacterium]
MATPVGVLRAEMQANAPRFGRDMGKSRKAARSFNNRTQRGFKRTSDAAGRLTRHFRGMIGSVVALAGPLALGLLIKRSLDAADAIAKTADKVGLTTDELQEMRYAAEQLTDVQQGALDIAMQRFSRRVGEVAAGTGVLKDVFEEYGIEVRNVDGTMRDVTDILGDYAEAIKNTEGDSQKLLLTFKGFDTEGAALVNMLKDGRDGMNKMRQEAHDLGVVIDEDLLRGAEDAKDALARLGSVIKTRTTSAVLELAPEIEELATKFLEALPGIIGFTGELLKMTGLVEQTEIDRLEKDVRGFEMAIASNNIKLATLNRTLEIARENMVLIGPPTEEVADNIKKLEVNVLDLTLQNQQAQLIIDGLNREMAALKTKSDDAAPSVDNLGTSMDNTAGKAKELEGATISAGEQADLMGAVFAVAFTAPQDQGSAWKNLIIRYIEMIEAAAIAASGAKGAVESIFTGPISWGILMAGLATLEYTKAAVRRMSFGTGGQFIVDGSGGTDSQLVSFWATPDERVTVETPAQQARGVGGRSVAFTQEIHIHGPLTDLQWLRREVAPALEEDARRLTNKLALRQ